ncbi:tail fiber assembly protein [Lysobacter enzymogenes]|uniref:tail fiber assembly protein n=1 Tax=Lysobacter enzymogenes TaxID=69 RepID=UPI00089C8146|nr:tail fiber assembly protein [Lysobacter enzymogenes]SDX53184.1 Phage tail assembly chaperone protein [Lysobacter enzymogenes]
MYRLTDDPDTVLRLDTDTLIPRGHRWWAEYEAWLAASNEPAPAPDTRATEARARRDALLRASDWTQLADSPLSIADRQAWLAYRVALRDLPRLPGFPDIPWPQPPAMGEGTADAGDALGMRAA